MHLQQTRQGKQMEAKNRWPQSFLGSFTFHLILFLCVALIAKTGGSKLEAKDEYVEVDYFAGLGGGGGGGGGEKPITHSVFENSPVNDQQNNSVQTTEQKNIQHEDTEQITDKNTTIDNTNKTASAQNKDSKAIIPGADQGANTGSGGGYGTGSGTGADSGSGSGGGHGSGTGGGVGSGTGINNTIAINPRIIHGPKPPYPQEARQQGLTGTTMVKIYVNEKGNVDDVELLASSGHSLLDQVAIATARKWRFTPARNTAGAAIKSAPKQPFVFALS